MKKFVFDLQGKNVSKFSKDLTGVETALLAINKATREAKKGLEIFATGTADQKKALTDAGKSVEGLKNEYGGLRAEQERLKLQRADLVKDIKLEAREYNALEKAIPIDSITRLQIRYAKLKKEISELSDEAKELPENIDKIREAKFISDKIDEDGEAIGTFRGKLTGYQKSVAELLNSNNELFNSFKNGFSGGGNLTGVIQSALFGGDGGKKTISTLNIVTGLLGGAAALTGSLINYTANVTVEYEKLNSEVAKLTGLYGVQLASATVGLKSLATVFDEDFNDILFSANALTRELTGNFTKSLDLIKIGLLANVGPADQFLDSIREYSTQAREAGISSERFIEILIRAQREGVFSDKGIDLVKEFGERVRKEAEATKESVENSLGKEFADNLFSRINDGSIDAGEALTEVAKKIKETATTSKQSQELIDNLFGTPGLDAGQRFIEILAEVDGNLDKLTENLTFAQKKQLEFFNSTRSLNAEQQVLANTFAGTGNDLETIFTNIEARGVQALNNLLGGFRLLNRDIAENGVFAGVTNLFTQDQQTAAAEYAALIREDAEAVRQLTERQKQAAAAFSARARLGQEGLAALRAEQAKLTEGLADARLKGENYGEFQDELTLVNNRLAEATKELNANVEKSANNFEEVLKAGSIAALTKRVSDLNEALSKTGEGEGFQLSKDLFNAENDLARATKQLEDFKEEIRQANVESLPIEEQVAIQSELIERQRQLNIQYANERINSEKELADEISKINLEADIDVLENSLRGLEESEAAYIATLNNIRAKTEELEDVKIDIQLTNEIELINEAERLGTLLLQKAVENEEVLKEQIEALNLQSDIEILNKRLELEELTNDQRFKLEQDLTAKLKREKELQALQSTNFTERNENIDTDEQEQIAAATPTFDVDNPLESLEAIKAFETEKNRIKAEAAIERLELEKELLAAQGQSTLSVENEIAQERLNLQERTNQALIDSTKNRLLQEQKEQEAHAQIVGDLITGSASLLGDLFSDNVEDAEEAQNRFIELLLDTAEKIILLQIATATAQSLAQPDSVATFGASGLARSAILTALIKAGFSLAKSAITSSEDGNIVGETFRTGGKIKSKTFRTGDILKAPSHKDGGARFTTKNDRREHEAQGGEAILNVEATRQNKDILAAMNWLAGGKDFGDNTAKWVPVVKALHGKKYAEGDIINASSFSRAPQIVNPNTSTLNATAAFSQQQVEYLVNSLRVRLGEAVQAGAERGAKAGTEKARQDGLRMAEREKLLNKITG